jgi:xanthine dehydrogenase small subunit
MTRYFRPRTLEDALAIRQGEDVCVLAGGTDIYPARTSRAAWGDPSHKAVLDISGIDTLRGIMDRPDHWRLNALTTWAELNRTGLPAQFNGYKAAAREVGGVQVQNRGTLAGNICTASPAGDGIPCLMALDASVELASVGERRVLPIASFIEDYRRTALRPDEIVTAILVPKTNARGGFAKLGARRYLVISIAMAAVSLMLDSKGRITEAAIAVGACGPTACRLPDLERSLVGKSPAKAKVGAEHLAGLRPIDDVRASAGYRLAAARQIIEDCLRTLVAEKQA